MIMNSNDQIVDLNENFPKLQPRSGLASKNGIDEVLEVEMLSPTTPLLGRSHKPPLARPEVDELDDDDNIDGLYTPQPGVDDGFFTSKSDGGYQDDDEIMPLSPRFGTDEVNGHEEPDSAGKHDHLHPNFFYGSGQDGHHEIDILSNPDLTPDLNAYQHKKTLAQGMMDIALFSANANQLRYVIESYNRHPYFYPSLILLSISLLLQVAVGIGLIWNATYNVKDEKEICLANRINNFTVIGIFLITVVNVFVSAFGVADAK